VLNLSGNIASKKEMLLKLMNKFARQENLGASVTKTIEDVTANLDKHFSQFQNNISYEDLKIYLDHNFNLQKFTTSSNIALDDAVFNADLGKKTATLPLGELNWSANIEADQDNFQ